MKTRTIRRVELACALICAAGGLLACGQAREPDSEAAASRIVLVTIDTLRADHLGSYGADWARTPHLDRLASRGVRFASAIAPTPMTQPSHATLFTGLDPPRHGLRSNGASRLPDDLPTLAERLRAAGFATAGIVGAVILEAHYGFDRGFEHFDDRMESRDSGPVTGLDARRADAVIEAALGWLSGAPSRFFLWVHLYDPHAPYDAPGRLRGLLARSPYDAEVSFVDEQVGRLVETIDSRWPAGGTLFAVTSDHGESLGEHDEDTHAYSIYDATQRVPLILAGAGLPLGRVVETQVRLADLTPTLLARVEAAPIGEIDGRDLAPLWSGAEEEPRMALVETVATQLHFGWSPVFGVRTGRYKYIRAPRPELYDLRSDPGETRNLALQEPPLLAELDETLAGLLAVGRPLETTRLDPSRRAQLERLGYVAPTDESGGDSLEVGGPDPKDHLAELSTFRKAKQLLRSGRPGEALNLLHRLPDSVYVATLRADAALAAGRAVLAERHARSALGGAEEDFSVYVSLGNALLLQGRLREAGSAFDDAARLNPSSPEPWIGRGLVAERLGVPDEAQKLYRRAMETSLASPEARWLLAALLIEGQRHGEAESLLGEVAPDLLEQPMAAARLAQAEARAGRHHQALARLEVSRRRFPESPILKSARTMIERERVQTPLER
jgi:arylsulfatase A-like enzyme/Tfp pilus assembly protein PilF